MLHDSAGLFVALDVVSLALAGTIAFLFWRTHVAMPAQGFQILALGFGVIAATYLTVAITVFDIAENPAIEAMNVGGRLLGPLILFTHYAARRFGITLRTVNTVVTSLAAVAFTLFLLYYFVPPHAELPPPSSYLAYSDLAQFAFLVATSYLIAAEIGSARLADYRVALAILLLGLAKYSWGLLALHGIEESAVIPYLWRIVGLLILLQAAIPLRRIPDAPS